VLTLTIPYIAGTGKRSTRGVFDATPCALGT